MDEWIRERVSINKNIVHLISKIALAIILAFVGIVGWCCDYPGGNVLVVSPPDASNLIKNYSFEDSNGPSFQGWTIGDTSFAHIVPTALIGGGHWSLRVEVSDEYSVWTMVALPSGTHSYKLTICGKMFGGEEGWTYLWLLHDGGFYHAGDICCIRDTNWTFYSVVDTLTASAHDSLRIGLACYYGEVGAGHVLFDMCTLDQLW